MPPHKCLWCLHPTHGKHLYRDYYLCEECYTRCFVRRECFLCGDRLHLYDGIRFHPECRLLVLKLCPHPDEAEAEAAM